MRQDRPHRTHRRGRCLRGAPAQGLSGLTARNILAGERLYDVWDVNEDAEYHEAGASGAEAALRSERLVPQKAKAAA
jgi:hypothetical protein